MIHSPVPNHARIAPDTNPKSRIGIRKPGIRAIPPVALIHLGQGMENGCEKYGLTNWRENSVSAAVYYEAAMRHFMAWWDGEQNAADSGVHHLGHVMACCSIILDAEAQGCLIDDRPAIKGKFAAMIESMTAPMEPVDEEHWASDLVETEEDAAVLDEILADEIGVSASSGETVAECRENERFRFESMGREAQAVPDASEFGFDLAEDEDAMAPLRPERARPSPTEIKMQFVSPQGVTEVIAEADIPSIEQISEVVRNWVTASKPAILTRRATLKRWLDSHGYEKVTDIHEPGHRLELLNYVHPVWLKAPVASNEICPICDGGPGNDGPCLCPSNG